VELSEKDKKKLALVDPDAELVIKNLESINNNIVQKKTIVYVIHELHRDEIIKEKYKTLIGVFDSRTSAYTFLEKGKEYLIEEVTLNTKVTPENRNISGDTEIE